MRFVDSKDHEYGGEVFKYILSTIELIQKVPHNSLLIKKLDEQKIMVFFFGSRIGLKDFEEYFGDLKGDAIMFGGDIVAVVCRPKDWALMLKKKFGSGMARTFIKNVPTETDRIVCQSRV